MGYTGTGQFEHVTRGSTTFATGALGLAREQNGGTSDYRYDPDGLLLAIRSGTSTNYPLYDGLGSVVATSDAAGTFSTVARYDPFGTCLENCPTGPFRWLGGLGVYFDSATGLYKMGTRYYDPALGRFTQVDPVEGGSANRYDYADQDPINSFDPTGELCIGWKCGREKVKSAGKAIAAGGAKLGRAVGRVAKRAAKPVAYSLFFGYGCYEVGKGAFKVIERKSGGNFVVRNGRIFLKRDPRFTLGLVALGCGVAITGKFEDVVRNAR